MQLETLMYHDWDCLQYCQTKEDCWAACRLTPPTEEQLFWIFLEKDMKKPFLSSEITELNTPPVTSEAKELCLV